MTAEHIPDTEWPAVISQGPGYYGLRLPQEYGTIVEYVDARALRHPGSSAVERPCDTREAAGSMPALGTTSCDGAALGAER